MERVHPLVPSGSEVQLKRELNNSWKRIRGCDRSLVTGEKAGRGVECIRGDPEDRVVPNVEGLGPEFEVKPLRYFRVFNQSQILRKSRRTATSPAQLL